VVYEMLGNVAQTLDHRDTAPPRSPEA
jgi:hypothetical protein